MKKAKRLAILVLAVLVVLPVLAGCKKSSTTATAKADYSKYTTVNIYNFGDQTNENWKTVQTEMTTFIKNKTKLNCAISLHFMTWTNWQANYATLIASGQQLDLVNSASDWLNMWDNAQKGAFVDLTKYLPVYAPKIWANTPQTTWAKCKFNGQIVCFPEDKYTQWVNHGYMYRGDWAKAAGLPEQITTWDQMAKYWAYVKANKSGVTPWDTNGSNYSTITGYLTSNTMNVAIGVGNWAIVSPTNFKVIDTIVGNEALVKTAAENAKKWGDAGYWKTDVLTNTDDSMKMLESGMNGTYQHHVQTFAGLKVTMDTDQPGSDLQMFGFWIPSGNLEKMSVTHGATCVGTGSKDPGRACAVQELIENNKDFYMLYVYGDLNKTYFLNSSGELYTPAGFDSSKDGYASDFWGGRQDKFEPKLAPRFAGYDAYSASLAKIAYDDPIDGFAYDLTSITSQVSAVNQVYSSELPGIATGKAGDPDAAVTKLVADLKSAGVDQVTAELQKQLDAWKAKNK